MRQSKREQAMVGLFVLIASGILIGTVLVLGEFNSHRTNTYHSYFPFAGGIEEGTPVRYSGGPEIGRVDKVGIDPQNASRIEVTFSVTADLPIKVDSHVKIMSLTPLGDNHVEIIPGSPQAAMAQNGAILTSEAYVDLGSVMAEIQSLTPQAQQLLAELNGRVVELKVTVSRVNDLLSTENRANISGLISDSRGMIQESRPQLKSTLARLNDVSGQLKPVLDDLRKTSNQATQAIDHIDALVGENRPDVHQAVQDLRRSLSTVTDLTGRLDQTVDVNSETIDQVLENLRSVTDNLREFTDLLKTRPDLLIRSSPPPDHKPGGRR